MHTVRSPMKKNIYSAASRKICPTFSITSNDIFNHSEAFANFIKMKTHLLVSCQISFLPDFGCSLMELLKGESYASRLFLQYYRPILICMPNTVAFREKCSHISPFPQHLSLLFVQSYPLSTFLSLTMPWKAIFSAF